MKRMNIVDSSGWLEYFSDGPNAAFFAPALEEPGRLVVPAITVYEVFKRVLQQKGEDAALQISALMHQGEVVPLDAALAMQAAKISLEHQLPMADSIIFATGQKHQAVIWTQDEDFRNLPNVRYKKK